MSDALFSPSPRATQMQQIGLRLLQQQQPPYQGGNPWAHGLMGAANSALGAFLLNRGLSEQEGQERAVGDAFREWSALPTDSRPGLAQFAASSQNPQLAAFGQRLLMQKELATPTEETFGTSFQTAVGPDGKRLLLQLGNRGSVRPVAGLSPPPEKSVVAGGGTILVDPDTGEARQIPGAQGAVIEQRRAGATNVGVSPTSVYTHTEGAAQKLAYETAQKEFQDNVIAAEQAQKAYEDVRRINTILGDAGGAGSVTVAQAQELARRAGVPVDEDNIKRIMAARTVQMDAVLAKVKPLTPVTEKEREIVESVTPGPSMNPEARRLIEDTLEAIARRAADRADYNGQLTDMVLSGQLPPAKKTLMLREWDKKAMAAAGRGAPERRNVEAPRQPGGQVTKTWRPGEGFK